jgi:tetratricopeptide (TPR) repeat protein
MIAPMRYHVSLAIALFLLSACSSLPSGSPTAQDAAVGASPDGVADTPAPEPVIAAERHFPDDSIYPLLVAEFALRKRYYDTALANYMEQSTLLRDRGVSAHTARLAQFMQRDAEAIEASQLWVELDPENLEARLTLANLLARQGRASDALPHMAAILRAGGMANFTALARNFDQLDPPSQQALLDDIAALLSEFPDNIQLRICKVLMLEEAGRAETALEELQPVFQLEPEQLQAVVLDAKLRQDLGQQKGIYKRLTDILSEQPDNNRLRMQYARLLTRTDMNEAEHQFRILLEQAPDDPDLLFSLALIQREIDDLDGARETLEKLVALNERTDEAQYYLGKTAEEQGRWEDAMVHYMQVQPGRDFAAATDRLAELMLDAGETAELAAYFDHLREQFPLFSEQIYAIEAEKLLASQYLPEAMQLLDRALEAWPQSTSLRYTRSMLSEQQGNLELAEADLQFILARDPDNATVLNALGYVLANRTDRYEEAQSYIARALALSPDEPAIIDSMGWVKYRLGDYETALGYLQRAYSLFPDPEVAAHLGEVLWALGETGAAKSVLGKALSASPGHEILLETIQRLGVDLASP